MQRERIRRERLKTRIPNRHPDPTLAERIALALGGNGSPITAEALNSLFSEAADALLDAEQEVNQAEAKALDPTNLDDASVPEALRAAGTTATGWPQRYRLAYQTSTNRASGTSSRLEP